MRHISASMILGLAIQLYPLMVSAQTYVCRQLPQRVNAVSSSVSKAFQDSDGYVWCATEGDGLCRDDGYQISHFFPDDASMMSESPVTCMSEDSLGCIWFASNGYVYRFDKSDYSICRISMPIHTDMFRDMYAMGNRLWLATEDSVWMYDMPTRYLSNISAFDKQLLPLRLTNFVRDSRLRLWAIDLGKSLVYYDSALGAFRPFPLSEGSSPLCIVHDENTGSLWVSTTKGFYKITWDERQKDYTFTDQQYYAGFVHRFVCARNRLWFPMLSHYVGVDVSGGSINKQDIVKAYSPTGDKALNCPILLNDGNLLCYETGTQPLFITCDTCLLSKNYFTPSHSELQETSLVRQRIVADDESSVVFSRDNKLVWLSDGHLLLADILTGKTDDCVLPTDMRDVKLVRGQYFIDQGVWLYRSDRLLKVAVDRHDGIKNVDETNVVFHAPAEILNASISEDCDVAWLVMAESVMAVSTVDVPHVLSSFNFDGAYVRRMVTTADGHHAWIVTRKGNMLYLVNDTGTQTRIDGVPDIADITYDEQDEVLWILSNHGNVYCVSIHQPHRISMEREVSIGKSPLYQSHILADGLGHVWMSSGENDITEWSPHFASAHHRYMSDLQMSTSVANLSSKVNIQTVVGNGKYVVACGTWGYAVMSHDGQLDRDCADSAELMVRVISVETTDTLLLMPHGEQTVELKPTDVVAYIRLTAGVASASDTRFAYRISGLDTIWHVLPKGTNGIPLINLAKGTYVVEAKATDQYGIWGQSYTVIVVHRLPAWWETWWAYTIYVILTVGMVLAGVLIWKYLKKRKERLRLERKAAQEKISAYIDTIYSLEEQIKRNRTALLVAETMPKQEDEAPETDVSDEFLRKALLAVQKNIDDPEFGIDGLCDALYMSRSNVYRKIKSLTGQKPSEFIRLIKLKYALRLLQDGRFTVSEVADKAGFSSLSYFSRIFKEEFGVQPSKYDDIRDNKE